MPGDMGATVRNGMRYTLWLGLGAVAGVLIALTDPRQPTLIDIGRHIAIVELPIVGALMTRLEKSLAIDGGGSTPQNSSAMGKAAGVGGKES